MLCQICNSEMTAVETVEIPAVSFPEYEIDFPAFLETTYACACKNKFKVWTKKQNDNII